MNLNRFLAITRLREKQLFILLEKFLTNKGYSVTCGDYNEYMYAQGQSSVCLVAHLDTVFKTTPKQFQRSRLKKHIISSPQGLGADDRAGVYAIMEIINQGLRPSVIFTTGEEKGGIGAYALITDKSLCPMDISCLVELDRQGRNDSIFYDCGNRKFEEFINSFGFQTDWGTYSDISIFAPLWDVAAVNLSVGYYNEHTLKESLNTRQLDSTIRKVGDIIKSEPPLYDFQEVNEQLEFWQSCFACRHQRCQECPKIVEIENGGVDPWQRKARW